MKFTKIILALFMSLLFICVSGGCSNNNLKENYASANLSSVLSENSSVKEGSSTMSYLTDSSTTISYPPIASVPDPNDVTESDLQKAINDYNSLVESLNVSMIDKIEIFYSNPVSEKTFTTTDKQLISDWISFFRSIKVSAKPYAPVDGSVGYEYSYYISGVKKFLCISNFPYMYTDSNLVMLYANYDSTQFDKLRQEMNIP